MQYNTHQKKPRRRDRSLSPCSWRRTGRSARGTSPARCRQGRHTPLLGAASKNQKREYHTTHVVSKTNKKMRGMVWYDSKRQPTPAVQHISSLFFRSTSDKVRASTDFGSVTVWLAVRHRRGYSVHAWWAYTRKNRRMFEQYSSTTKYRIIFEIVVLAKVSSYCDIWYWYRKSHKHRQNRRQSYVDEVWYLILIRIGLTQHGVYHTGIIFKP